MSLYLISAKICPKNLLKGSFKIGFDNAWRLTKIIPQGSNL
jgi:hypothetical protein